MSIWNSKKVSSGNINIIWTKRYIVNTKSRLRPSVFSVRLFQTQYQLAAGDVSTNLSHFHWCSRILGI